ncbi:MAG: hypothetical protein ACE5E8_04335 [Acidimicrobiia bacterium]
MSGRGGIEIPGDVAATAGMPDDLDAGIGGEYTVPSTRRRLYAGFAYLAGGGATAAGSVSGELPTAMLWAAGLMGGIALWHFSGAWSIRVADTEALQSAGRAVGFAVGHASAVVGFDGWRSKPIWNVLLFSAEDPPQRRALVRLDAVDGSLVERYEEAVGDPPEAAV